MMHAQIENPFRLFWDLGYRDLLPVTPPDAITPAGKPVPAAGKRPGVRVRDGGWVGRGYDSFRAEESDLDEWRNWGAGVGMRGSDNLFFVDIDHMDPKAAEKLRALAETHLGPSKPRIGQAPKMALPYRSSALVASRAVKFDAEPVAGKAPGLDIISTRPFMVVAGAHAATGRAYDWPEGVPAFEDLPEVTPDQVSAFLRAVEASFPFRTVSVNDNAEKGPAPDQSTLLGDPETVRSAMRVMPNMIADFDRDEYVEMGYALRGALGPDLEEEAYELFLQWCGRCDVEQNWDEVEKDWRGMKPPFRVGADYIYRKAEELAGWTGRAEQFFEPQELEGEEEHRPVEGYQILSVGDVMKMRPPRFLIDRHIPETGFGILYGDPGCGKSFVALDMALTLAYGLAHWHGDRIEARSRKVLYIAGEGSSGFQSRIAAWQAMHEEETKGRTCEAGFLFQPVNFMKPEDIKRLVQAVMALGQDWAMIFVDTVSRAIPGADENMQKDMTIFVHACDALRMATSAFVMGVHHTAKTGTMRGSSVFLGQADVVLRLTRQKGASVGRLECEKQKDAPDGWGDAYRFSVVEAGEGRQSLVPVRLSDATPGSGSVDVGLQNLMLKAADAAWRAGEPWSENARAGERYAVRVLCRDFNLNAEQASALLDIWMGQRLIVSEIHDKRSKKKGLKVAAFVTENASESDDASGEDGVFG